MIEIVCPQCGLKIERDAAGSYTCKNGDFLLENRAGVLVDAGVVNEADKDFYDAIYNKEHGQKWFQGLNRASIAKRILERISLSYRRDRFFKRNIKGSNNIILDIACGAGRDYFKDFGEVVGIDLSRAPLEIAKQRYAMVIQGGVTHLPFADDTFDYVMSSDFFGHVLNSDKDAIIKEIYRVLKPGGKTLHVIETDSTNIWIRIAHRDPELFKKYFILQIGGHIGLEMPSACVARWKTDGFTIVKAKKIWGLIWPIQDYAGLFGNEYADRSLLVRAVVFISKLCSRFKIVQVLVNIMLNPVNSIVETILPFDNGQGVMIVCQKNK